MKRNFYTITGGDVGKRTIRLPDCPVCGHARVLNIGSAIGRVQTIDVGKRAYYDERTGHVEVENQQQFHARRISETRT